jgi:hypothetical protein
VRASSDPLQRRARRSARLAVVGGVILAGALLAAFGRAAGTRVVPDAVSLSGPRSDALSGDTLQARRDSAVAAVLERIAGREADPAGEVFENVELLEAVPAERLLRIMDVGFGRSLGVACDHCHVVGDWASDEKRPKRAARAMWRMVARINQELLPAIDALDGERPTVNCTTCHRGDVVPATRLP